jgi:DNA-binding response OmpR family regulator
LPVRAKTVGSKMNFLTVPLADLLLKGMGPQGDPPRPIVLVVDDAQVIADTRAMILEQSGISAMVAYDGKSALEIARMIPPDLLLTDVAMPGMNGIDLATAIRQIFPNCGILLFSGEASTTDSLDVARVARQEFTILKKPLHPTELLARVSDSLQSRARRTEIEFELAAASQAGAHSTFQAR